MMYYILYPGDDDTDLINDINQLGEQSFKVFWASGGFNILQNAIKKNPDVVEHFIIKDDKGKSYSIEEFLDKIAKLQIRTQ